MRVQLKRLKKASVLFLVLAIALVPAMSIAAANPQLSLRASGKIVFAVFPLTPMPAMPGYSAVLAVDLYHFNTFQVNTVDFGPFDLLVVSSLNYLDTNYMEGIPIPMTVYTDAPTDVVLLLTGVFTNMNPSVVITQDSSLMIKVRGRAAIANGAFGSLMSESLAKKTLPSTSMVIDPTFNLHLDIARGREAVTGGVSAVYGELNGMGFASKFKMYTA
jgi:hypothetical protein